MNDPTEAMARAPSEDGPDDALRAPQADATAAAEPSEPTATAPAHAGVAAREQRPPRR